MATSKLQRKFSQALSRNFGGYTIFENSRPEWCLGNDLQRLELDFWIVELDVAVEVQGAQHYHYVPHFHGDYSGFKAQQERDKIKRRRCEAYGVTLLEVDDALTFADAIEAIRHLAKRDKKQRNKYQIHRKHNRVIKAFLDRFSYLSNTIANSIEFAQAVGHLRYQLVAYVDRFGAGVLNHVEADEAQRLFALVKDATATVKANRVKRSVQRARAAGVIEPMPGDSVIWCYRPVGYDGRVFEIEATVVNVTPTKVIVKGDFQGETITRSTKREALA